MAKKKKPAAPSAPLVKTVAVTALKYHTIHGGEHQAGDTYQVPDTDVASLVANGFAAPASARTKSPTKRRVLKAGKHKK